MSQSITIDRLGRQGDGIAETPGGPVFLPFTLPGERVTTAGAGGQQSLERVESASPDRIAPICQHFGICGGCQMQHAALHRYLEWKTSLASEALAREGVETLLKPIVSFGAHLRRRVVFTAIRGPKGMVLGFSQRSTNTIIDLQQCPVLLPAIETAIPALRLLASVLAPKKGVMKLSVVACENGLDVAAANGTLSSDRAQQQAVQIAISHDFSRLSLNGDTLVELRRPLLACGKALVTPPPEAFVQAVAGAEDAMTQLAVAHLAHAKAVADLFCGFGTFALRLAEHSTVLAVESSAQALAALERSWRETGGGLKAVTTLKRDLYRNPLTANEMTKLGGVVFDPPRAGAQTQAQELAKSKVARIAAISCNPVSLARDLRILIDGGYKLVEITPVDQFVFTPHVECVALLER